MKTEIRRMVHLSIATSLATLVLKFSAWFLTDSVSLFSDAAESLVNLSAALIALAALTIASRPADSDHTYGHDKAEYFSSGAEGALILVAALSIIVAAVGRLLHPVTPENLAAGIAISLLAGVLNFATARRMLAVARKYDSIVLEADAHHLMTDVWTSVGVLAGLSVVLFAPPSWRILDPLMAIAVGINIIYTGFSLIRRSWAGLMDAALPLEEILQIEAEIRNELPAHASFHDLRTRKSGARRFIEFHLLLPGKVSVRDSHHLCDRIEEKIGNALQGASTLIHVEPIEEHETPETSG